MAEISGLKISKTLEGILLRSKKKPFMRVGIDQIIDEHDLNNHLYGDRNKFLQKLSAVASALPEVR